MTLAIESNNKVFAFLTNVLLEVLWRIIDRSLALFGKDAVLMIISLNLK